MITNINQIIRDVVASSEDLDPHDVARRVLKELDPSDYENVILDLLPANIRIQYGVSRNQRFSERDDLPAQEDRDDGYVPVSRGSAPGRVGVKQAAIYEAWQRKLKAPVHTANGYRTLEKCTYNDLVYAAQERQDKAEALMTEGRRYNRYAAALTENGVETFGDLPTHVKRELLTT